MLHLPLHRAVLLALTPSIALPTLASELPSTDLEPLIVTATKSPSKIGNIIAQTHVIDQGTLVHYHGQSVLDVLKSQAGFNHYSSGGSDKTSNIYLRGYDGKSVLVLINGARYASLSTGTAALGQLPVNEIERIEILYGASGTSLYGADAVGGVIQIFTKSKPDTGANFSASFGAGSHGQLDYGVSVGAQHGGGSLNLSVSHSERDGVNAIETPIKANQQDKDGFSSNNVSLSFNHQFSDNFRIGASLLGSKSTSHYDNTYSAESNIYAKQKNGAASAFAEFQYRPDSSARLQYGNSVDESTNYAGSISTDNYDNSQEQISLHLRHALPVGHAIFGAEHLSQRLDSSTNYTENKRKVSSALAGYLLAGERLDAQAFVRYDDNSQFGGETTYNAGLAYRILPSLRAGASYAKGYRAPTFNELYYPIMWGSGGNPNLRPETSDNYEAFVEHTANFANAHARTRITGYQNKVTDMIVGWTPSNIARAEITGGTLTSDWQLGNYLVGAHYDYQDAEDLSTHKDLPKRPQHKAGAYIGYQLADVDVRAEYQYVGKRYSENNEKSPLDGYALVNLSGSYQLSPKVRLSSRIHNLLGKKYHTHTAYGTVYQEQGTSAYAAINISH